MRYGDGMLAGLKWNHPFRIDGGSPETLLSMVERYIFYHMQHPLLLDLFAESTAALRARVNGDSALLMVDADGKTIRIQRPLGPAGPAMFQEEIRACYGRKGILAAGLAPDLAGRFATSHPTSLIPIEQYVEFSSLDRWDPVLCGSLYKTLRSALHSADREGIEVDGYDAKKHGRDALKIFEDWNSRKPRTATYWMPRVLEAGSSIPALIGVAARKNQILLGVTFAFVCGSYGYMLMAVTRERHGRAQEAMDYELLNRLRALGVRRLDWGVSDGGTVLAYKKKYGDIRREPITTFWIPPSPSR